MIIWNRPTGALTNLYAPSCSRYHPASNVSMSQLSLALASTLSLSEIRRDSTSTTSQLSAFGRSVLDVMESVKSTPLIRRALKVTSLICTSPVCCQRAIISREVALVNSIRHRHFRDSRPEVCLLNEKVDSNDQGRSGTRYRMCDSTELKPVDPCSNLGQRILYPRLCSLQKERLAEKSITNQ